VTRFFLFIRWVEVTYNSTCVPIWVMDVPCKSYILGFKDQIYVIERRHFVKSVMTSYHTYFRQRHRFEAKNRPRFWRLPHHRSAWVLCPGVFRKNVHAGRQTEVLGYQTAQYRSRPISCIGPYIRPISM